FQGTDKQVRGFHDHSASNRLACHYIVFCSWENRGEAIRGIRKSDPDGIRRGRRIHALTSEGRTRLRRGSAQALRQWTTPSLFSQSSRNSSTLRSRVSTTP